MMKRSRWAVFIVLLLLTAGALLSGCIRTITAEEAIEHLKRDYPDLSFAVAEHKQGGNELLIQTEIVETELQCQVQRKGRELQDNLKEIVLGAWAERVDSLLSGILGIGYTGLSVVELTPDNITFAGLLPDASNASFRVNLTTGGKVRLALPTYAVAASGHDYFEVHGIGILPAGSLVLPLRPVFADAPPSLTNEIVVRTDHYGDVAITAAALLVPGGYRGAVVVSESYEMQISTQLSLLAWPAETGSEVVALGHELSDRTVVQVVARWQGWSMVLSAPFPWYPESASRGWVKDEQLVPFSAGSSPDAWIRAGALLRAECEPNDTITLYEPLLMRFCEERDGNVLLVHPQDTTYWTEVENVIGRNPFREP